MSLETAAFVSELTATNPVTSDNVSQGDDHIRLLKSVLKATFPNASRAFYIPTTLAKSADYSVLATDMFATILATTTGGAITFTLPSLTAADAGWEVSFIKVNTGTNPFFIAPASGTIQSGEISGLAKARRCIPGRKTRVFWTGTAWIAERTCLEPIGTTKEFPFATLPDGYEWANGETLASASTNYPEFYAANGNSGVLPDHCGRVVAGQDDMGGISSKNRLTGLTGGVNGDTLGAVGGAESHILTEAELPTITPAGAVSTPVITTQERNIRSGPDNNIMAASNQSPTQTSTSTVTSSALTFTGTPFGSDDAHNNVQPTIIQNKIVVVE